MECCKERPNRSDVHLSVEEEAKLEAKAREYFDEAAPKRHTKPQRSEYSTQYVDSNNDDNNNNFIPELVEFQRLENDPQVGFSFQITSIYFSIYLFEKNEKKNNYQKKYFCVCRESNPGLLLGRQLS